MLLQNFITIVSDCSRRICLDIFIQIVLCCRRESPWKRFSTRYHLVQKSLEKLKYRYFWEISVRLKIFNSQFLFTIKKDGHYNFQFFVRGGVQMIFSGNCKGSHFKFFAEKVARGNAVQIFPNFPAKSLSIYKQHFLVTPF